MANRGMDSRNPYTAPRAEVADGVSPFGKVRVFSVRGRIGRARYIAYTIGLSLLIALTMGLVIGFARLPTETGAHLPVLIAGYGLILLIHALLSIQRAHDFDASGWLAIIAFVPVLNLLFWFIPGNREANRFGPRPPPNGLGATVLACILPFLFVVGIVAAVALPAYNHYLQKAHSGSR